VLRLSRKSYSRKIVELGPYGDKWLINLTKEEISYMIELWGQVVTWRKFEIYTPLESRDLRMRQSKDREEL
jgi:hypothetical protein